HYVRRDRIVLEALPVPDANALLAMLHRIDDRRFDGIFTKDRPVIFAYNGYPYLINRLTYRRTNHGNIHVSGFVEEGTTTTP
ncbi:hypothetical protein ACC717_37745, partial [Rhizobium ruizarguesonis]